MPPCTSRGQRRAALFSLTPPLTQRSGALQYPGGIPASLKESGQQWDYPNAWPPLQHMLIEGRHRPPRWTACIVKATVSVDAFDLPVSFPGLSKVPSEEAKQLASELAQRWIRSNWLAYTKHKAMFEKVTFRLR